MVTFEHHICFCSPLCCRTFSCLRQKCLQQEYRRQNRRQASRDSPWKVPSRAVLRDTAWSMLIRLLTWSDCNVTYWTITIKTSCTWLHRHVRLSFGLSWVQLSIAAMSWLKQHRHWCKAIVCTRLFTIGLIILTCNTVDLFWRMVGYQMFSREDLGTVYVARELRWCYWPLPTSKTTWSQCLLSRWGLQRFQNAQGNVCCKCQRLCSRLNISSFWERSLDMQPCL